jgi:ABC-type multidrug transport system fused ATPase/permease subunit
MYILTVIFTSYRILGSRALKWFASLQAFYLVSAVVQVFGIASIGPFITILSRPEIIHSNAILSYLYTQLGFSSDNQFMIASAFLSILLIGLSNLVAGVTYWLSYRFAVHVGSSLQNELFASVLKRPYLFHKMTDHTAAIALVNDELPRFVYQVLMPLLVLISQALVALVILVGLLVLNPVIALSAGAIIGGGYLLTYFLLKKALRKAGKITSEKNRGVQATLSEAFQGVKEIKLKGNEQHYVDTFEGYNLRGLRAESFFSLSSELPKLVIESISFGAILLLAAYFLSRNQDPATIVGLLSLYALAGYKLLPTVQQVYSSIARLSAHGVAATTLDHELAQVVDELREPAAQLDESIQTVGLRDVSFSYPGAAAKALKSINVEFTRNTVNTIVGPSGSGKSTLADIVLGLLRPNSGQLLLNDTALEGRRLAGYMATIGYLPQHIFLTNDSVLANVAFGVPKHAIDRQKVCNALAMANANGFVDKLPAGVDSVLGQDGKLLSGGQRQRIGIARALYNDARVLVLDEPTSALDIESEHDLMQTLHSLRRDVLVIIISHRAAAIKMSDNITLVDHGEIVARGTYFELEQGNPVFRKLMAMSVAEEMQERVD